MIRIDAAVGARIHDRGMAKPDSEGKCPEGYYVHIDRDGHKFCIKMYPGVEYKGLVRTAAGVLQTVAKAILPKSTPCSVCGKRKS